MISKKLLVTAHLWVLCIATQGVAAPQAFLFTRMINGDGSAQDHPVIVVDDGVISKITTAESAHAAGLKVTDLSRYTAIAGLIDAHVHMTYVWDQASGLSPWQYFSATPSPTLLFRAQLNARKTLEAGVTTVRDLSANDRLSIQMRDLIASAALPGPRMWVAGVGLHVTLQAPLPGMTNDFVSDPGRADGVAEVMRAARLQMAAGADWIKLFGSTGSGDDLSGQQTFTFEEIEAAVEIAHHGGKRVAVHSYGAAAAREAVRAGVDSLEHAVDLDTPTLRDMVKRNITYVPTIDHNRYYVDNKDLYGYDAQTVKSLQDFIQRSLVTVRKAHQFGVRLAMGSDAVFTMFGENTRELAWFVKAGLSPSEALATATVNGAALLGMEDHLGQLKPGFYADIVALEGDPREDIGAVIHGVRWVMKAGVVVVDETARPTE